MSILNYYSGNLLQIDRSNNVEASAGTGKTFSIGILALRLLVEGKCKLPEILMVTFTEAAAAELQDRIRRFVRLAYRYSIGFNLDPEYNDIMRTVDLVGRAAAKDQLEGALTELHSLSVFTIHSFCQRTLSEFAFDTGQPFILDVIKPERHNYFIKVNINDFLRNRLNIKPDDLLFEYLKAKAKHNKRYIHFLSRQIFNSFINQYFEGKEFISEGFLSCHSLNEYNNFKDLWIARIDQELISYIENNRNEFINRLEQYCGRNKGALLDEVNAPNLLIQKLGKKKDNIEKKVFGRLMEDLELINKRKDSFNHLMICELFNEGVEFVSSRTEKDLVSRGLLTFESMITKLYEAVHGLSKDRLTSVLNKKYRAVFIDEFQDTDNKQFEIFHTIFSNRALIFFIGDPKQAIYGWRSADLNTYFKSLSNIDTSRCYSLTTNYRSSQPLINAFNHFFQPTGPDFDTFFFKYDQTKTFEYSPFTASNAERLQKSVRYKLDGDADVVFSPLTIYNEYNEAEIVNVNSIYTYTTNLVIHLIKHGKYSADEKLKCNDIAILVRTNEEGEKVKKYLTEKGVPVTFFKENNLFKTEEAKYLLYYLEAIQSINVNNIRKALLSPFILGLEIEGLMKIKKDWLLNRFQHYLEIINKNGIYETVLEYIKDFDIHIRLVKIADRPGLQIYSTLLQLAETLQEIQTENQLLLPELISYLKNAINDESISSSIQRRTESDKGTVKIMTIHRSKGLEFDIVIAPFLDMDREPRGYFSSFRTENEDPSRYLFVAKNCLSLEFWELYKKQTEQENRRLLYVALTRAKYHCFLFKIKKNTGEEGNITTLGEFYTPLLGTNYEEHGISIEPFEFEDEEYTGRTTTTIEANELKIENFSVSDKNWRKMSYSYLSASHEYTPKDSLNDYEDGYERFIFKELERGKKIGNLLHTIFEWIDFTKSDEWSKVIEHGLKKYFPKEDRNHYIPHLLSLTEHILKTKITIGDKTFQLCEVGNHQKCNEFEFDANIAQLNPAELTFLADENTEIRTLNDNDLQGILNGKMDLFFEHGGKYYILDWKSNYLGDHLENYDFSSLNNAMNENNYHLQYYIYTFAAVRFLKSRIKNFDYEKHFGGVIYLFLRGVRKDGNAGIFTRLPTVDVFDKLNVLMSYMKRP